MNKIILPLSIFIPCKTKEDREFKLNLNIYRNTHHFILNKAKELWKEVVQKALLENARLINGLQPPYHFTYTIYQPSGRSFDVSNVGAIIDKFTADALQEFGLLENDNYKNIPMVTYKFVGIDKVNPRAELEIVELNQTGVCK